LLRKRPFLFFRSEEFGHFFVVRLTCGDRQVRIRGARTKAAITFNARENHAMSDILICPKCNYKIEVSAALTAQLRDEVQREFEGVSRQREAALAVQEKELHAARKSLTIEIDKRVAEERARLATEAEAIVRESLALELNDLHNELAEAQTRLADAQKTELELRKERRQLDEQKRELELTLTRRMDEERDKTREEAKAEAAEEHRLREADTEKLVGDLRRQINELKRKSEQAPQWVQGEVQENELESALRQHFPFDTIEPIPVSKNGGDVLQHVNDGAGQSCGAILWESKRTKTWNDGWLAKLTNDQVSAQAAIAAMLSTQLPKGVRHFGCVDGIWVTDQISLVGLATALRAGLIEVARVQRALVDRHSKEELIYRYVSSSEFRQRIQCVVDAIVAMKHDLESEKRSLGRIWAKRDKQLGRAIAGIAYLYGHFDGIIGGTLDEIPELELAQIGVETADDAPPALEHVNGSPF
jgi:hypothetical protein